MAVIIGIDEAGYGPLLGPLAVSAVTFELPDELLSQPLWDIARKSVVKTRKGASGRVVVNDSKKLHTSKGYGLLERGVLAFLFAGKTREQADSLEINTVSQLQKELGCKNLYDLERYPWYCGTLAGARVNSNIDDVITAANALRSDFREKNLIIREIRSIPLPAGEYNDLVDKMKNKAKVLFHLATMHIHYAWQNYAGMNLNIVIDKHGGRSHYREQLQKMYPDSQMKILKESDTTSSYQMAAGTKSMKIHFLAKGDQRQLPIALASMASKYLRELYMETLNNYFIGLWPDLKPTAGYYQDGKRFLADLEKLNIIPNPDCRNLLIRQR